MSQNKKVITFLCKLEGYKTAIKNCHFSAANMSEHQRFDEIADIVSKVQDEIGEIEQGIHGQFSKNIIRPIIYTVKTSKKFLQDAIKETNAFYKQIQSSEYIGLRSVIETFLGDLDKYTYLIDISLKEDFMRNYKKKINESTNRTTIQEKDGMFNLSRREFNTILDEAINNVLGRFLNEIE